MKKRIFAAAGLVAVLALGVAAQNTLAQTGPGTDPVNGNPNLRGDITVFTWSDFISKANLDTFKQLYPRISVKFVTVGYPDAYPKIAAGFDAGAPVADVIQIESEYVEQYASKYPNAFTDLTPWAAQYERDFDRAKWAQATVKGKLLALPTDSAPVGFWYRADMFEKAGVRAEDLDTWDQFVNAGARVMAANPGVKLTYIDPNTETLLRTIVQQQGSFYINTAGEVAINNAQMRQGLKVLKRLWDEQLLLSVNGVNGVIGAMKAGKIASVILPVWNTAILKPFMPEQAGKWGVTTVPALGPGGGRAASIGGSNLMVSSASPNKEAAWAFTEFLAVRGISESFKRYGTWASYLPLMKQNVLEIRDPFFVTPDIYKPFTEVSKRMRVFRYSSDFDLTKTTVAAAQRAVFAGERVDEVLTQASKDLAQKTGRLIAR
jgi:lactose/L-arabinose transport system substrate-binding protein